jgi:hypothetical protein
MGSYALYSKMRREAALGCAAKTYVAWRAAASERNGEVCDGRQLLQRKNCQLLAIISDISKLNLVIDALLLLCIAAIAGIRLLMKYVLVPEYQRWEIYNRNVELFFWGLGRHDWGAIHFVIALVFLALLILDVVLHWGMIVGIYRKLIPSRLMRCIIAVILISLTILLLIFPYFAKPEIQERGRGRGYRYGRIEGKEEVREK